MQPLISIVLPVYNGEKYLRQSIDSVLDQTYTNWELLIIDDGSTDASAQIAQEYAERDSRILYHRNPENMRLPRTLNRGFSLTKGDCLTWTSDDNYYYPTALRTMYDALIREGKEFAFASCDVINGEGQIIESITVNDSAKKVIVGGNPVGACFLYSRRVYETIGDYDPSMTLVEDFDYWQRICARFEPVCIPQKLYAYRWHDGALTSTMKKDVFNRTLEACLLKNRSGFGKLDFITSYYYYSGLYQCRKNLGEEDNPYKLKYGFYRFLYTIAVRVPNKLKRMMK
ncbi:MAG: glycosyltransferase family 2 protein [Oscillospiraceae bacterium]|nr:glycosyltransferase family 2 protein [Oscillospiraceae bacterium]